MNLSFLATIVTISLAGKVVFVSSSKTTGETTTTTTSTSSTAETSTSAKSSANVLADFQNMLSQVVQDSSLFREPTHEEYAAMNVGQALEKNLSALNSVMDALESHIKNKDLFSQLPEKEEADEDSIWNTYAPKSDVLQSSGEGMLLVQVANNRKFLNLGSSGSASTLQKDKKGITKLQEIDPEALASSLFTFDDARCTHTDEQMKALLENPNVNELALIQDWIYCPSDVRNRALDAFFKYANDDSIRVFFSFNAKLGETFASCPYQVRLMKRILSRASLESALKLIAFFDQYKLLREPVNIRTMANLILERGIQAGALHMDKIISLVKRILPPGTTLPLMEHAKCGKKYSVLHLAVREGVPVEYIKFIAPLVSDRNVKFLDRADERYLTEEEKKMLGKTVLEIALRRPDYRLIESILRR